MISLEKYKESSTLSKILTMFGSIALIVGISLAFYFFFLSSPTAPPVTQMQQDTSGTNIQAGRDVNFNSLQPHAPESTLDRVIASKDGSRQGQNEAIRLLLDRGYSYQSSDFNGVSFTHANLSHGVFQGAKLHATDLTEANCEYADFSKSGLRFAKLERGNFLSANLSGTYAPFILGAKANFAKADLSKSNFFGADLQGANFQNANLRGAAFVFSDLRGAIFDGADLTGTYLLGAVLDNATFTDTKLSDTDLLGAATKKIFLTAEQKKGVCRHSLHLKDNEFIEWDVRLIEKWPSNKYSTGFEFKDILNSRWVFYNFSDKSLPLCSTPPDGPPAYDTRFVGGQYMHLDRAYISKAGREFEFIRRVEQHINFLKENIIKENNLKGDSSQIKELSATLRNAIKNTEPISNPHINTDLVLLILLKAKLLNNQTINWERFAKIRYEFETNIRNNYNNSFELYSMWGPLFPSSIPWNELPEEKSELYKDWTLSRINKAPKNLIWNAPFYIQRDGDKNFVTISLKTGFLYRTPEGYTTNNSWPNQSIEDVKNLVIDLGKIKFAPVNLNDAGLERVVFSFPNAYDNYYILVPKKLIEQEDARNLQLQISLLIDKFEIIHNKKIAIVFVIPNEALIRKIDKIIWSGKLNIIANN